MLNTNNSAFEGFIDSDADDNDFFSLSEEAQEEKTNTKENPLDSEDSKTGDEQKENKATQKANDTDLFAKEEEQDDDDDGFIRKRHISEDEEEDEDAYGDPLATFNYLKSKGLIEYEPEEGEEITAERAAELVEDSIDEMLDEKVEDLFKDVPPVLKEINRFVLNGGDINTYLAKIAESNKTGLTIDMDLDNEDNQILSVRQGLKAEGYNEEYISAQIDFLKDSKRLKGIAATHYNKWKDNRIAEEQRILRSKQDASKVEKENRRELKKKVVDFLQETDEVTGFKVTRDDKKQLPDYMSERTVKLDNGAVITGMQHDLMRVLNSPTGSVQIAKLLKAASKDGELNFTEIIKDTETKVTKQVRENVRRNKKSINTGNGDSTMKRSLASYFD